MKTLRLTTLSLLLALCTHAHAAEPSPRPQDDLFRAANGAWLASTEIPAAQTEVFGTDLNAIVDQRVRAIAQGLTAARPSAGSSAEKVATFYASYLDTARIDRAGLQPIQALLKELAGLRTVSKLAAWQGRAQGRLQTPVWLWGGFADFMDPTVNRVMAWQGGLGLPDRDHYLHKDEPRYAKAYAAYERYLTELARLSGDRQPAATARSVLALEGRLAEAHVPLAEARDPAKMYNPMNAAELAQAAPGFDWAAFLAAAKMPAGERVTVTQRGTAVAIAKLYAELPLKQWQQYLTLRSLDEAAPVLPAAFRAAHFRFHGQALGGAEQPEPRWQQGIAQVSKALNDPLAQLYVEQYLPAADRQRVVVMVDQILAAYQTLMAANTWMTPETKAQALVKLSKYKAKVGYPKQWRDHAGLTVRAGDALGNRQRAQQFEWQRHAAAAGRKLDRDAWQMSPLTVNAFYDPMGNEINLPAAHLQAPWFDAQADDAANYGGLGALIGHEISHGFDPMGSQFDGDGVMRNGWTPADRAAFDALGARLAAQYDSYEVLPGLHVNGKQTLPENMADLIGLQIAFKAYQTTLKGMPSPIIDGLSGEQRFFLSYARSWRGKFRAERLQQQLSADVHAPFEFRANGPVVNVDGFHEAFNTQPGDRLYKPAQERIRPW